MALAPSAHLHPSDAPFPAEAWPLGWLVVCAARSVHHHIRKCRALWHQTEWHQHTAQPRQLTRLTDKIELNTGASNGISPHCNQTLAIELSLLCCMLVTVGRAVLGSWDGHLCLSILVLKHIFGLCHCFHSDSIGSDIPHLFL
eukprot:3023802-Amphidinium_carterae.1